MRFAFADQRHNGARLLQALRLAGHELAATDADVLLADHDSSDAMQAVCAKHRRVLIHPHGAGYVGLLNPKGYWYVHERTRGMFVHGPGQAEVLKRAGYPLQVASIGWSFGDRRPFRALSPHRGRRLQVLLAPQHAMSNDGWVDPSLQAANLRIYRLLRALESRRYSVALTIRYVGPWGPLGLPNNEGVPIQHGADDGSPVSAAEAVDQVDCVIAAAWTFPCIALSRGCPVIVYGQHGYRLVPIVTDPPWPEDPSLERYPHDAGQARTPDELYGLIMRACTNESDIETWRERFIGPPFDGQQFVRAVERAVAEW